MVPAAPTGLDEPIADAPVPPAAGVPRHVAKHLLKGSAALGFAVSVERGMGFLANILAARLGGAGTFGAYSLAISTANNISTYAGGGIGATAARFSGKYRRGGPGYSALARALAIVSIVSALLAAGGLWLGASPLAHLMQKASLARLLRWTVVSAVGIILLECARGFFIGQSRLPALLLLSVMVGLGMVFIIPFAAAGHDPVRMIILQGIITTAAVITCLTLARPLGLLPLSTVEPTLPLLPMLREVWSFGMVQLAGLIGVNFAGWWLTTLLARADSSLAQMSFFAIASQLRNIAGLAPSMLTESSYAMMADQADQAANTPQNVMALCTYASTMAAFLLAGAGIIVAPWAILLVYGRGYVAASTAVVLALVVSVIHMGNAPAAARLSIVSIRATAVINTLWAAFVALAATVLMLHRGSAWKAMGIYLTAHFISAVLVLCLLSRKDYVPKGMVTVFALGSGTAIALAVASWARAANPANALVLTAAMAAIFGTAAAILLRVGRIHRWVPSRVVIVQLLRRVTKWSAQDVQNGA